MDKQKTLRTLIREKTKEEMVNSFGSVRAGILAIIYASTVGFSRWFILGRNSATNYFLELIIDSVVVGGLFYIGLYVVNRFRAPYLVGQDLLGKNIMLEGLLESKELNLFVEQSSSTQSNEQGDIILYLLIDVVNQERRKIVELDAHLTRIDQWTKQLQDGTVNDISTSYMGRLQWDDGSYQVELKPDFPELKKLRIATLNCMSQEFKFIHKNLSRTRPHQQNARYRITINLKGKLEDDPDYRFYKYITEFLCSPQNSILDYRPEADGFPNLPDELKDMLINAAT